MFVSGNEMFRIRLLHIYLENIRRRFKYYLFYITCLFVLYSILTRTNGAKSPKKSSVNLNYVTVHFDLKGSPPKLTYIASYLSILNMYGVNSILMEYEDMFPYEGSLANISSVNAYKKYELLRFLSKADSLNIEVIPLIQTFGHMEFVLKLKEFAHLRELDKFPSDICPSNPNSRKLIAAMLKQVIDFHAKIKPLAHIHIGCDEVMKLNKCQMCSERRFKDSAIFTKHVEEVTSVVKELSPFTKVLIWGDMLQKLMVNTTEIFNNEISRNIEPVEWKYESNPKFSNIHFYKMHKNFQNIWIASAFKGADGRNATIPDIKSRFLNHLSWMKFILDYKFGGETEVYNFEGIILTGWSRYSHMALQCELFPIAIPSLILNLMLIRTVQNGIDYGDLDNLNYCEFFTKYISTDFNEIFRNYGNTGEKCAFENTFLYTEHNKVFDRSLLADCLSHLHEREYECRRQGAFVDVITLESTFAQCKKTIKKLAGMKENIETFMLKYYKAFAIKSYIDEVVQVPTREIKSLMDYLHNCTKDRFWGRRF